MRRKNYLNKLTYHDENFCRVVKNSHHISQTQALTIISRNRIDSFEKQGVLRKLHYMDNSKKEIVYELTKKGRDWISRNFSNLRGNFYTASTAILHNVTLAQQIIDRPYTQWLNERDLRKILIEQIQKLDNRWELMRMLENGQVSVPDGGYRNADGSISCIEVYNDNYTLSQLQWKMNFQTITNLPITYIKQ